MLKDFRSKDQIIVTKYLIFLGVLTSLKFEYLFSKLWTENWEEKQRETVK
jgi:hypothetical protein